MVMIWSVKCIFVPLSFRLDDLGTCICLFYDVNSAFVYSLFVVVSFVCWVSCWVHVVFDVDLDVSSS